MATILRDLSYQYQGLYDFISRLSALSVGGEARFRQLALQDLSLQPEMTVLDLCCGCGQTTRFLTQRSHHVTGLDAAPRSLARARAQVPQATFVEGWAEEMPLAPDTFDVVHSSVALHEMKPDQLRAILAEVYRVLRAGGQFALIDLHSPSNPFYWVGLAPFMALFETATAWQFIDLDLPQLLRQLGFQAIRQTFYAGGSLQVIQAQKPL